MPKKTPKKITLENLAKKMDDGFKRVDQKMDEGIDQLALAVKNGFDENTKQHQQIFNRIDNLEQGQGEIKLKLTAKLSS